MSKGSDEEPEIKPYKNSASQDLESFKQLQRKVDNVFKKVSEKEFELYAQRLQEKNTYFNNTKYPEVNSKDIAQDKLNTLSKYSGKLTTEEEGWYCPYCTSRMTPCPHTRQRENIKQKYEYPIVSSAVYGWFKPYDNLMENYNKNSVTKEFYDPNHLS